MLFLALVGHILNNKVKCETHVYGIENVFKKLNEKKRHSF